MREKSRNLTKLILDESPSACVYVREVSSRGAGTPRYRLEVSDAYRVASECDPRERSERLCDQQAVRHRSVHAQPVPARQAEPDAGHRGEGPGRPRAGSRDPAAARPEEGGMRWHRYGSAGTSGITAIPTRTGSSASARVAPIGA